MSATDMPGQPCRWQASVNGSSTMSIGAWSAAESAMRHQGCFARSSASLAVRRVGDRRASVRAHSMSAPLCTATLHCRPSLRGTRTAVVSPAALVRLHASPCDFVWVTHASGGSSTLLKLVAEAAAADGLLLVGEDTLSELLADAGHEVHALAVCAGAVQPWAELELRPLEGCATAPLPSAVRPEPSPRPIPGLAFALTVALA